MISNSHGKEDVYPRRKSDQNLEEKIHDYDSVRYQSNDVSQLSLEATIENENCFQMNSTKSKSMTYLEELNQFNYIPRHFEPDKFHSRESRFLEGYKNQSHRTFSTQVNLSNSMDNNGQFMGLAGSQVCNFSQRTMKAHPGAYVDFVETQQEDFDRTDLDSSSIDYAPSEDSRGNDSVLTLNAPSSVGQDAESCIMDTNITSLQSDAWPDIEILEEKFTARLKRRRYLIWTFLLLIMLGIVIGLSIAMTKSFIQSRAVMSTKALCSIETILQSCHENMDYPVKIPPCLTNRYQALQEALRKKFHFEIPNYTLCAPENLALLSVSTVVDESKAYNTTILQRYGLTLLYFATKGRLWKNHKDWLSKNVPYCQWGSSHIVCSSKGFVRDIVLTANNLQGNLPSNLMAYLPRLKSFIADMNSLTGSIPSDLSQLSYLSLGNNLLSGTIPMSIIESETMMVLSISQNNAIVIDRNQTFFNGSQWKTLSLGKVINLASGSMPSEISKLTNLQHLDWSASKLTGTLPSELALLKHLVTLDLSINNLNGTLPTELGNLKNLTSLSLSMNELTATIPSEIGNLKQIKYIYLDTNALNGVIPSEICGLVNLVELTLSSNDLSGRIPDDIGNLTNLETFEFVYNNLDGEIPEVLCVMKQKGKLTTLGSNSLKGCVKRLDSLVCPASMPKCCCM
jgi:hypothetical protein